MNEEEITLVKSMTGYGRARETRSGRDITVEVRSVNNRYLDCTVKMPRAYIFAEDAVKARVQKAVSRGKVDVFITIDTSAADEAVVKLNRPLAQGYYKALCEINEACGLESEITASTIARFPDVLTVTKAEEDLECVAVDLCAVLDDALAAYNRMRATEGERLAADIGSRLDTIEHITGMVEERSPQTVAEYRARLTAKMEEVLRYIARHLEEELTVEALAGKFYISRYYLMHRFKAVTGYTLHQYISQKRLLRAGELIRSGVPVMKAAEQAGFGDYSTFLRAFQNTFHMSPREFR